MPDFEPIGAAYVLGLNDYSLIRRLKPEKAALSADELKALGITEIYRRFLLGRYYLNNGKSDASKKALNKSLDLSDMHPEISFGDKPEARNLKRLTEDLTLISVGANYNSHAITSSQDILEYFPCFFPLMQVSSDVEGQNAAPPFRATRLGPYVLMAHRESVPQKLDEGSAKGLLIPDYVNIPPLQIGNSPFMIDMGGSYSKNNQFGTTDTKFTFSSVNKYTPDHLLPHVGQVYPLITCDDIYRQSGYADLTVSMLDVMGAIGALGKLGADGNWIEPSDLVKWVKIISPILINKISFGIKMEHTGMTMTSCPYYGYSDHYQDLSTQRDDLTETKFNSHFDSYLYEKSGSFETRTFPLLKWPFAIYLAMGVKYQVSTLDKNMADSFWPLDSKYVPPTYDDNGNPFSAADIADMQSKHDAYNLLRGKNTRLGSQETHYYLRANLPGPIQCARGLSLVNVTRVEDGADEPLKLTMDYGVIKNNSLLSTNSGIDPSGWNYFPPYIKNGSDPAQQPGPSIIRTMPPQNAKSFNFSVSYMPRLGHFSAMESVLHPKDYFKHTDMYKVNKEWDKLNEQGEQQDANGDILNSKNKLVHQYTHDWKKIISKSLWAIPSAVLWPVQKAAGALDEGKEIPGDTHLYVPIEFGRGWNWYTAGDVFGRVSNYEAGNYWFRVGLNLNKKVQLMYGIAESTNGNGYHDKTRSLSLTVFFNSGK